MTDFIKPYFDLLICTPLEVEFLTCLDFFPFVADHSQGGQIQVAVRIPGTTLTALLIRPYKMGRAEASEACVTALGFADFGMAVCIGIAGAISNDLNIGDVCHTGEVWDVLDNASVSQVGDSGMELFLSPTTYETPRSLTTAFNLTRVLPDSRKMYIAWQEERFSISKTLITRTFPGKNKSSETIQTPKCLDGAILCAQVTKSTKYKEKMKSLHRHVLAVETESGSIFQVCKRYTLPVITVRGISDYADEDKNAFETATEGHARSIAAINAVSYLALQLSQTHIIIF